MQQPDTTKPVRSKPPTREELEKFAYDLYAAKLAEIDFLVAYNDLMEEAFMYGDTIKEAIEVVSNDEVLANYGFNAAVNRFKELNKEQFLEIDKLKPSK
jgi:hypothetical protein